MIRFRLDVSVMGEGLRDSSSKVSFSMNGACHSYLTVLAAVIDANWSPHQQAFRGGAGARAGPNT